MVSLYLGVPGSGKSLHATKQIVFALKRGKHVMTNLQINTKAIKKMTGVYEFRNYEQLNPLEFVSYALEHNQEGDEHKILLVIDEAQVLINSRDFSAKDRMSWVKFITNHRHLGYDVILITQYDKAIDKQIRNVVETQHMHKCLNRMGPLIFLPFKLFIDVEMFVAGSTKVANGHEFFTIWGGRKYYNTHQTRDDIFLVFPEAKRYIENRKKEQELISLPSSADMGGDEGAPAQPQEKDEALA